MKIGAQARRARAEQRVVAIVSMLAAACGAGDWAGAVDRAGDGANSPAADGSSDSSESSEAIAGEFIGDSESVESCRAEAESSEDQWVRDVTATTIELGALAPPDRLLEVSIQLGERDDGSMPSLDRLSALVTAHGGEVAVRFKSSDSMLARLPAQHLDVAFCWPSVISVAVTTPYWDVVTPPWDTSSVGASECPVLDGACPEHCEPILGSPFDAARGCLSAPVVVTCNRLEGRDHGDSEKCRASTVTGQAYHFGGAAPFEPAFSNYRDCTGEEYRGALSSPFCDG